MLSVLESLEPAFMKSVDENIIFIYTYDLCKNYITN